MQSLPRGTLSSTELPDPHHIEAYQDIDTLQGILPTLVYTRLDKSEEDALPDKLLAKLLRMSQIHVQTQIESQDETNERISRKRQRLAELRNVSKKRVQKSEKKRESAKKKLHRADNTVKGYRALVSYLQLEMRKEERRRKREQEKRRPLPRPQKTEETTIVSQPVPTPPPKEKDVDDQIHLLIEQQQQLYSQLQQIASTMQNKQYHSEEGANVSSSLIDQLRHDMKEDRELLNSRLQGFMKDIGRNVDSLTSVQDRQRLALEEAFQKLDTINSRVAHVEADTRNATELANRALETSLKNSHAGRMQSDERMIDTSIQTEPLRNEDDRGWKDALQKQIDDIKSRLEDQREVPKPGDKREAPKPVTEEPVPVSKPEPKRKKPAELDQELYDKADNYFRSLLLRKLFHSWKLLERGSKPTTVKQKSDQQVIKLSRNWKSIPEDSCKCYSGSGYWTIYQLLSKDDCESVLSGRTALLAYAKKLNQRCRRSYNLLQRYNMTDWADKLPAETEFRETEHGIEAKIPEEWTLIVRLSGVSSTHEKSSRAMISVSADTSVERIERLICQDLMPRLTGNMIALSLDPVIVRKVPGNVVNHETCAYYSDISIDEADMFWHRPIARVCGPLDDTEIERILQHVGNKAKGTYDDDESMEVLGHKLNSPDLYEHMRDMIDTVETLGVHLELGQRIEDIGSLMQDEPQVLQESPYLSSLWEYDPDDITSQADHAKQQCNSKLYSALKKCGVRKSDVSAVLFKESATPILRKDQLKEALQQTVPGEKAKSVEETLSRVVDQKHHKIPRSTASSEIEQHITNLNSLKRNLMNRGRKASNTNKFPEDTSYDNEEASPRTSNGAPSPVAAEENVADDIGDDDGSSEPSRDSLVEEDI